MLDDLVGEIYETVTDRGRLAKLAARLQDEFTSHASALVIAEPDRYFLMQSNVSPDSADAYNQELWHNDIWMQQFLVRTSETVLSGHQMCAYSDIPADYRHHVLEAADTYDGLSVRVMDTPEITASISLYRSRSQDIFQTPDFEKMLYLAPHLKRSLSLQQVFGGLKNHSKLLARAIDHIPGSALIVDPSFRIVAMNASAEKLLSDNHDLGSWQGRLIAHNKAISDALHHSLAVTVARGIPAAYPLKVRDRAAPMIVRVARLDSGLSEDVRSMAGGGAERHLAIITFTLPEATLPAEAATILSTAYGLTPREAETAILVAEGMGPGDAADRMGVKLSTFRSFLKSALGKMDTNRQSELAAKVQSLFAGR